MTFLSILLFASAFYFANALPDAYSTAKASAASVAQAEPVKPDASSPNTTSTDAKVNPYQKQIDSFIQALDQAMSDHVMPIITELNNDAQEELKAMAINGCYSYINFVIYLAQEKKGSSINDASGIPDDRGDIIIELDELDQVDENAFLLPAASVNSAPDVNATAETTSGDISSAPDMEAQPDYVS